MKILHIIFSFKIGGSETMLADIINQQVRRHEVTLCVINHLYDEELLATIDKRAKIILLHRIPGSRNLLDVFRLNYWVHHKRFHVIHCHESNIQKYIVFRFRLTSVLTVHGICLPIEGIEHYKTIVSISRSVKDDLEKRGINNSKVIYNGIHSELVMPANHLFLDKIPNIRVLQIGRLEHSVKGQHVSLEALSILTKRFPSYNIHLTFMGEGASDRFLKYLSKKMRIGKQVYFEGKCTREYIYSHIRDYDILVQPSLIEGFGLTVVEAMTAGIPVLVSDIDGPMEIISNGECGFFFRHNDSADMANRLIYMIEHREIVHAMVEKGKVRAQNFTLNNMIDKYEQIYSDVNISTN